MLLSGDVFNALEIMAKGMSGIFISLSLIYILVILLMKLFPAKRDG
jgi:hypothetical protein